MTLPTVSELVRGLEPVTRDPFMDGLDTVAPHPGAARELLDRHQVTNVRSAVADVAPVALLVGTVVRQLASGDFASALTELVRQAPSLLPRVADDRGAGSPTVQPSSSSSSRR